VGTEGEGKKKDKKGGSRKTITTTQKTGENTVKGGWGDLKGSKEKRPPTGPKGAKVAWGLGGGTREINGPWLRGGKKGEGVEKALKKKKTGGTKVQVERVGTFEEA